MESDWKWNVVKYGLTGYYPYPYEREDKPFLCAPLVGAPYLICNYLVQDPFNRVQFMQLDTDGLVTNYGWFGGPIAAPPYRFPYQFTVG